MDICEDISLILMGFRGATVQVHDVFKDLQPEGGPTGAHDEAHGGTFTHVSVLSGYLRSEGKPASTHPCM